MSRGMPVDGRARLSALVTIALSSFLGAAPTARAQLTPPAVPELDEGAGIITNKQSAIALGKALFWDQQAGSDGLACASCHFHAGADSRLKNQLSPGFNDLHFSGGDSEFGSIASETGAIDFGEMPSGNVADSNYTLVKQDFPLHRLADYKDRNSPLISTTNDVVSSAGSYAAQFLRVNMCSSAEEVCGPADGAIFHAGRFAARQVEPRNAPTTINAAFYFSNFWDGRANNQFNGVGVFGARDIQGNADKRLIVLDANGAPQLGYLQIRNASLASQAVGPVLSALEMSCAGRTFADVGRKLLQAVPLSKQQIASTDSVLGPYARGHSKGLHPQYTYAALIQKAFESKYWSARGNFRVANGQLVSDRARGYSQMETNFSMFWGLAIMMYERQLISDQSRFDSWFTSCRPAVSNTSGQTNQAPIGNPTVTCVPDASNPITSTDPVAHGLTAQEVLGFGLFQNGGTGVRNTGNPACAGCHGPVAGFNPNNPPAAGTPVVLPILSEAAFAAGQNFNPVERSLVVDRGDGLAPVTLPTTDQHAGAVHDRGFFNVGVTPASQDVGNGGLDPYGNPLSIARMFLATQAGLTVVDPPVVVFPPAGTPLATVTTPINRCTSPGVVELGGTPRFVGCAGNPVPAVPEPLYLDASQERELVDGGFKTPSLRNIGLTAPYFHSGNYSDLRSVVEFYARGGSRRSKSLENASYTGDNSGSGPLGKNAATEAGPDFGTNVDFFVRELKSTDEQIDALVAFMLTLTDKRVQCDQAPFDHPELTIPVGHSTQDKAPKDGRADDLTTTLPAVGSSGYTPSSGYCIPNKGDLFAPGMQGRVGGTRVPLN